MKNNRTQIDNVIPHPIATMAAGDNDVLVLELSIAVGCDEFKGAPVVYVNDVVEVVFTVSFSFAAVV